MNPDDKQQQPPSDYLNQIAPKTPKTKIDFLRQKPILIGLLIVAVIIIITLFALMAGNLLDGTKPIKTLSARLASTSNTATLAKNNIKNTNLRALNSSLNIYLSNTIRDMAPILVLNKIDTKKIDKNITAAESNTKLLAILEDARLNAIYDRTYAREMASQLEKTLLLMNQINNSSKSSKTKSFLDSAIKNLTLIQKQFADYNSPVSYLFAPSPATKL